MVILNTTKFSRNALTLMASVIVVALVAACTTYQQTQKVSRDVSPALASIHSIAVKQVTCKAVNCPGDLKLYNSIVSKSLTDQSDFTVVSSSTEADAQLVVNITNYLDRSGSAWGSDKSGEISYTVSLISRSNSATVWSDTFSKKDIAVSDNLFKIKESHFAWQTTPELFAESFRNALRKLSLDRQSLFIR